MADRGDHAASPQAGRTQHRTPDPAAPAAPGDRDRSPSVSTCELEVGQFSDTGRKRQNNEDWLGTFRPEDAGRLEDKGSLFLLADGMGGHKSGELASRQAVDRVIRAYMEDGQRDVASSLRRAVQAANTALYDSSGRQSPGQNSGTTLVAGVIRQGELWVANVGDSRAYLLHRGALQQISEDHSWAAAGARAGLGEELPGRHVLTRALGAKAHVEVDVFGPLSLEAGDRLILCSDGLTTPLTDDEIREIAGRQSPQKASEALVQAANERGGPDNVSVLVVEIKPRAGQGQAAALGWKRGLGSGGGRLSPTMVTIVFLGAMILIALGFVLGLLLFGP